MKLNEIIECFGLAVFSKPGGDPELTHGYASDLLSDVMANAGKNSVWLTMQTHLNIVAVAELKDIAAVLVTGGRKPAAEIIATAESKGVCILGTGLPTFEAAGRLHAKGLRGTLTK